MEALSAPYRSQHYDVRKRVASVEAQPLTPVAGLALLRQLSQEIEAAQRVEDGSTVKSTGCDAVAELYAQRAATLLEYADYDASVSVPLDAISFAPDAMETLLSQQQAEADERRAQIMVLAVQQAQEDANKALQLAPSRVEGYFLAAQCFRSSGMLDDAAQRIATAVQLLPHNAQIAQLAKEIAVERANKQQETQTRFPTVSTPPEALVAGIARDLSHLVLSETPEQQLEGDNNDEGDGLSHRATGQRLVADFEQLRAVSESPELARLETMMHHNVHHQCASPGGVRCLEHALKSVVSFLLLALRSSRMLGLSVDALPLEELLKPKLERVDWHHALIQDRAARKWLAQTLAPSTRPAVGALDSEPKVGATLLRDVLTLLSRVLLAVSGWRRCTAMPHALVYAELGYDLVKELVSSYSACPTTTSSMAQRLTRLETACSDAYGVVLRDLLSDFGEALALHQESLETAVLTKDRAYELRGHHLVGQALLRMKEPVLAQAEFMQLLVQSQEEADAAMEALARFELGESCVQRGELDEALVHLRYARTICNQTGSCAGMWRMQSIHRAIDFYTALKPAKRRDAVLCASTVTQKGIESGDAQFPVRRPGLLFQESSFRQAVDENHDEPQHDMAYDETQAASVVSKLFASDSDRATATVESAKPVATATKPRRRGGWRDSVFAAPPSALSSRSCSSSQSSSSSASQFSCSPASTSSDAASSTTVSVVSASSAGAVLSYTGKQTTTGEKPASHRVVPDELGAEGDVSGPRHASL